MFLVLPRLVFTWRAFRVTRALAPAALTRRWIVLGALWSNAQTCVCLEWSAFLSCVQMSFAVARRLTGAARLGLCELPIRSGQGVVDCARQPLALPGPERSPAPAASPAASPAAAAAAAAAPATPGPAPATSPNMGSRRSSHASVAASAASSNGANGAAASAAPVTPMTTTPRGSVATPSPEVRRRKKKGR